MTLVEATLRAVREVRDRLAQCVRRLQEPPTPAQLAPLGPLLAQAVGTLYALEAAPPSPDALHEGLHAAIETLRTVLKQLQEQPASPEAVTTTVASCLARLYPLDVELERASRSGAALPSPSDRAPAPVGGPGESPSTTSPEEPSEGSVVIPLRRRSRRELRLPDEPVRASPATIPESSEPVLRLERRRSPRRHLEVGIGFHSDSNFYTGFSGDISTGGIFVATYDLLPVGTQLTVSFWLPDGMQITTRGRVAWVREPDPEHPEVPPGMGVAFEELPLEAKAAVERFLRHREPMFHDE